MRKGLAVLSLVAVLSPAALSAQGMGIDHRKVGCIVAGKYARLNACFAPASRLARARVYFRVADAGPSWYYVEMASNAPCHEGVLPRPKKELVGRRIQYYVDALDRAFAESRTSEAEALVVSSASQCSAKAAVAPVLNNATVAVFPSLPAGFAGAGAAAAGLSGAATALIAVGGAGIVGGGVALATGSSSGGETAPTTTAPPETLPPAVTTTTTTTLPAGFKPVMDVFKGGTLVTGTSVTGTEPLTLTFDMCRSTGPYRMRYAVWVDGQQAANGCYSTLTFTTSEVTRNAARSGVGRTVSSRVYDVLMTIRSEGPNNSPQKDRELTVQVDPSGGGGCSGDTTGPVVSLTKPTAGAVYSTPGAYPVHLEASASDATTGNNGVAFVEYKVNYPGPDQVILGPVYGSSPWPYDWTEQAVMAYLGTACSKVLSLAAYAQDGCGNATLSSTVQVTVYNTGTCVPDRGAAPDRSAAASAAVVSELGVPGGAGQVVANGEATFPRAGRHVLAVRLQDGENRVEATLVEARSGGTWRFELGALPGLRPESLRVVAGDVVQLAGDSVTFRLQGRPGERIVFGFRTDRP
jgi:Bacterial Ig domain